MSPILQPGEGEALTLRFPSPAELVIKVDPRQSGSPFAMGTQAIPPGGEIPVHRHLHQDEVLFVHKGQGRATLDDRTITVVPGVMVYVPRQAWHGLRNTGTGVLHLTWTVAPPGLEQFFRELSQLSGQPDPSAIQALAQRYGVELRPATERSAGPRPAGRRHRRRRGGGGRPHPVARPQQAATPKEPPVSPPPSPAKVPPKPRGRPHRGRHVKEVYMGGKWIQVAGEGPVIASGKDRAAAARKERKSDEPPGGPLSVSL